ncbi:hypothetical protein GUITHDRAFT_121766 [Guillardia theta CCMP2712]|uniref:Ammonium transporter AmtB-like domain-containing protein n=1 Tax=Guillardia theta (strain CCMP2712) TaxID=905079 RepID=L1I735_GUITC|nr:hypothetical protein GUITHDRAFT_121766 [Guillardia theta CCMP2712]EKX32066.1 hypothetical protein GUITHDRAFT_121766 [Guillardia theta CCMP2712]|eukprot:XP_005819046.1 hypothetical protein GUITHDRAFT_121766 [Guillardia theta CCMP2712]
MGLKDLNPLKLVKAIFQKRKKIDEEDTSYQSDLALQPSHLVTIALAQAIIIVVYYFYVVHETFPKPPDIFPAPGLGEPGGPIFQEPESVTPFKRYPPGYDIVGPRPDGTLGPQLSQPTLQREYKFQIEIVTYVYLGFGMQYSFLRKFGFSTIAFGLLAASIASQWGFFWMQLIDRMHCDWLISKTCDVPTCSGNPNCLEALKAEVIQGTFQEIQQRQACTCYIFRMFAQNRSQITELPHHAKHALYVTGRTDFDNTMAITSPAIMEGLFATVPVQITMGILLGKVSLAQLSAVSMICVTAYGVNFWLNLYVMGAYDNLGGSCVIHLFGACFGIGCTLLATLKGSAENPDNAPRYNADVMAIIGTILNWMTFPSFNAYFAPAAAQQAVVVNTYLSLFSSCVASMIFSSMYSRQLKLDPADVQRSSLAGGVSISSVVSLFAKPQHALIIGVIGGFVCSTSHHFLRRILERKTGITDTVGVISLHAFPGLIAWIAGIIAVWGLDSRYKGPWSGIQYSSTQTKTLPYWLEMDLTFQHHVGNKDTALYQASIYMAPITICVGLGTGLLGGLVARWIKGPSVAKTFTDSMYWVVPDDFLETEKSQM